MRVVYWFTSLGGAPTPRDWDKGMLTRNANAAELETEGFWYLWKELLERKILDEVLIVVESARGSGSKKWGSNFGVYVIPHIDQIEEFLRPDDVIVARGGFRSWFPILGRMNESKRWVIFYRAATHRLKWPFWDIVLEDLTDKSFVLGNRLHYKFNKPIHPDIFNFRKQIQRDIDVMFHASHIHDKKGQWKCVDAAIAYKKKYGEHFIGVMPGSFYGGEETRKAFQKVNDYNLPIWMPGFIPRRDLCMWMNRCKLYIHLGVAGQNDRGNLESMLCGCQQIIGNPHFHPPFVYNNKEISSVVRNHAPEEVATVIHDMLVAWRSDFPSKVASYYQKENGIEVAVGQMRILFDFIKRHKIPNRELAIKELGGL